MSDRNRSTYVAFWISDEEKELIQKKMELMGISNMSAYLRKMAIDGYTVRLDLPELNEMVSLLRYAGNNLNQLTKRVHETGRLYDADLDDIKQNQERLWDAAQKIIMTLSEVR